MNRQYKRFSSNAGDSSPESARCGWLAAGGAFCRLQGGINVPLDENDPAPVTPQSAPSPAQGGVQRFLVGACVSVSAVAEVVQANVGEATTAGVLLLLDLTAAGDSFGVMWVQSYASKAERMTESFALQ